MPGPYNIDEIIAENDPLHIEHHTALADAINESTPEPLANVMILRDSAGRAKVADPSVAQDIATKGYVDTGLSGKANTVHGHALTDANITGVLPIAQVPTGTTGTTVALGNHGHSLSDSNITGTLPISKIPTGTSSTTVALGNHTHTPDAIGAIPSFTDPNVDRIVFWDDSAGAYAPLAIGTGLAITGTTLDATGAGGTVADASETVKGIVELATVGETTTGTDTARAVTPAGVKAVADTKAATTHGHALTDANITGVLPIAQIPTGTTASTVALGNHTHTASAVGAIPSFTDPNADRIVFWDDSASAYVALAPSAPLSISGTTLSVGAASETATGVAERATDAETQAMTDTTRYISPANLAAAASTVPTSGRLARYDASGTLHTSSPTEADDVTTKNFVDNQTFSARAHAGDFRIDRITEFVGPTGSRLTIPTHVSPAGGQTTHPTVVYSPDKFGGYHYWMAHTPYPASNDDHEDPNLAVSNDGITWIAAPGVTQPLDDADGTPEYNSDVDLKFGPDGRLYLFWRHYDTGSVGTEEKVWVRHSSDGVNWSTKALIWQANHTVNRYLSPSFLWEDNRWKFWAVDMLTSPNKIVMRQATVGVKVPGISDWGAETICTTSGMQSGKEPWHLYVDKPGSQYIMILNDSVTDSSQVDGDIVLFTSSDGTSWAGAGAPMIPRTLAGEHDRIYRATFVPEYRNGVLGLRVWYSAWIVGPPAVWNVYRTWVGLGTGSGVVRHGSESIPTVAANTGGVTIDVTFPLPYDREPVVVAYSNSGRLHLALLSKSKTGFSVRLENYTSAQAAGALLYWSAYTP
jgi:hypothetical protein